MKIAIIAPTEIPSKRANTLQVMKMAQAFRESGHHVHLIAPQESNRNDSLSTSPYSWDNLAHHYGLSKKFEIDWLPAYNALKRYDFSLRALQKARNESVDIIYTRLPQMAALSSALGLPTILEAHDIPQGKTGPLLFQTFLKGRGAKRLVVITHALYQDIQKMFKLPANKEFCIVAPDGVDLERYQDLPSSTKAREKFVTNPPHFLSERLKFPENFSTQFTAGYTGHLYRGRGTHLLLELAAQLPEINFLIAGGEAQDIASLKHQAVDRELKNIYFLGFIPNSELPLVQAACDVLLMPYQASVSASSGGDIARYLSPMKLFEYMASQRAILSSNLPVLQEILNNENAILLPSNDVQAWSKALTRLQSDQELTHLLARKARQDVFQYTWHARANRILEGITL